MIDDGGIGPIEGRLLDLSYRVTCDDPAIADVLRAALGDSASPVGASATHFEIRSADAVSELVVDGVSVADGPTAWVFSNLLFQLNRHTVAADPIAPILHAGAVVRDGLAVLVVGPSGVGKTVTTLGLAARGFDLLSDDIVRVRPDGSVDGSPKPVGMRSEGAELLGLDPLAAQPTPDALAELSTRPVAASALGVALGDVGRPSVVVFPDPDETADAIVELSPGEGLARCCDHAFSFGVEAVAGFELLGASLDDVVHLRWGRGSLDRLAHHLDKILTAT